MSIKKLIPWCKKNTCIECSKQMKLLKKKRYNNELRKNGFWYFTIVIEPHKEYQYYNGISESYIKVRGELLAEHIKMLQNIENKQYT